MKNAPQTTDAPIEIETPQAEASAEPKAAPRPRMLRVRTNLSAGINRRPFDHIGN